MAPTKPKLAPIIERLVGEFGDQVNALKLNLDGCPHACGQHWTGDIGLQGTTARGAKGEPMEAFDIILRGGLGREAAIGKPLLRRVPSAAGRRSCRAAVRRISRSSAAAGIVRGLLRTND